MIFRADTYWFQDWFYPIYEQAGNTAALNGFFDLLSKNFPQNNCASFNRPQYTRDINMSEFVHFWSGAGKTNLKNLTSNVVGWTDKWES
ncbi:MAG: hypothetical protein GAK29_04686 [Acinetobacter bereziniae]|uniref:Uncharacterized protein n=1 Tax=Acinetobacter bereziniae TaxID=106648 RepID=A0A833TTV3_ACIBZ|nr:MAG: hypothetical protein GAK29_04686 [Acinetobacter bereziniae]